MSTKPRAELGTLISGTHKSEDLIKAFTNELDRLDPRRLEEIKADYDDVYQAALDHNLDEYKEEAGLLLSDLEDALNDNAPAQHFFGSHSGDGADYGFWPIPYMEGDEV